MDPVSKWSFAPSDGVAKHLKDCPYNVRVQHKAIAKDGAWDEVLKGVKEKAMAKQVPGYRPRMTDQWFPGWVGDNYLDKLRR